MRNSGPERCGRTQVHRPEDVSGRGEFVLDLRVVSDRYASVLLEEGGVSHHITCAIGPLLHPLVISSYPIAVPSIEWFY